LSKVFTLDTLSPNGVLVYLNDQLLCHGTDYVFTIEGFVNISATLAVGDEVEIYEYDTTDACFVPTTPTKLGLYPAYKPEIFLDTTYQTPKTVIQGHDGSITFAYGDFRDNLILDFERRIYNNLKQKYNTDIFDITDFQGGNFRDTGFNNIDINNAVTVPPRVLTVKYLKTSKPGSISTSTVPKYSNIYIPLHLHSSGPLN
jgi:hypothetical protein